MRAINVRSAQETDLGPLVALDAHAMRRWSDTPSLSRAELEEWYRMESPFFLVAEHAKTCGYYFGYRIAFSPDRPEEFLDLARRSGRGYSTHPHDPSQDSVYGISVVAVDGAGSRLKEEFYNLLEASGIQYYVGFTRMIHFDRYCRELEQAHDGTLPYPEEDIALWYAYESARLLEMRAWPKAPPRPCLPLPALRRPDPVLAFHVQGTNFRLLGLQAGYLQDRASRNYGICIASRTPHR